MARGWELVAGDEGNMKKMDKKSILRKMSRNWLIFSIVLSMVILIIFILGYLNGSIFENKYTNPLKNVKTWMYQIQGLEEEGAVEKLDKSNYDLLVIDPVSTEKGSENFDIKSAIKKLKIKPNGEKRIVLAYVDIGEAESYRTYWTSDWKKPSGDKKGNPDFILTADPDGWSDNYPVAYWDKRWKKIWTGENGIVQKLAGMGFDGLYLDWVEAYDEEKVIEEAKKQGRDPAKEMVNFISGINESSTRFFNENFIIVSQNAPYLIDEVESYVQLIDGLAMEDTWFRGEADADWNDPLGGDIKNNEVDNFSTKALLKQYKKYLQRDIPVFSADYCLKRENADYVYKEAKKYGLRPLVTRVSLSNITTTPPDFD